MISPNPATTYAVLKFETPNASVSQLAIYSLLGNQIFQKNYSGTVDQIPLNLSSYKKGKYLLKVIFTDGTSEVKALIKE